MNKRKNTTSSSLNSSEASTLENKKLPKTPPSQHQEKQPGSEKQMHPRPESLRPTYKGSEKLKDKVAIITGGDSGIGRAVAYLFAIEGAKVIISYLNESEDANETKENIEKLGSECLLISGDVGEEGFCKKIIEESIKKFDRIDIVVNNAAEQHPRKRTYRTY